MKSPILTLCTCLMIALTTKSQTLSWAKQLGGIANDEGYSIAVDASGNVYTTGYFTGTVDFDPGPGTTNLTAIGLEDAFVLKMNAVGNIVWAKQFGGSSSDFGRSIAVDASGNVYTTGGFNGTVDFDPGPAIVNLSSAGGWDIFISKLNASGNFVWVKQLA